MVFSKSFHVHPVMEVHMLNGHYQRIFPCHIYPVKIQPAPAEIKQSHAVIPERLRLCKYIAQTTVQMAHYIKLVMGQTECRLKSSDCSYDARICVSHCDCQFLYHKTLKLLGKLSYMQYHHLHKKISRLIITPRNFYILISQGTLIHLIHNRSIFLEPAG